MSYSPILQAARRPTSIGRVAVRRDGDWPEGQHASQRLTHSEEVAMFPTIAEQHAAMRRRELQEEAMTPYDTYRLYQIERPKSVAEIRYADERAGRLAAAAARMLRRLTHAARPHYPRRQHAMARPPASSCSDRMATTIEAR
jgi:hypothetical protein